MRTAIQTSGSVDATKKVLSYLVTERQRLRDHGADGVELEANRQAIVAMQWHLSRALGEEFASRATPAALAS